MFVHYFVFGCTLSVGKSGGGNQGRETKTKSIRKKYLKGSKVSDESDDEENSVTVSKSRGDFGGPVGRRLGEIHFLTTREIRDVLKKQPLTEECSEDMLNELSNFLAGYDQTSLETSFLLMLCLLNISCFMMFSLGFCIHIRNRPLTTKFQEVARSVFLSTSASNVSLRKSHSEVQDKINGLVTNIHLFVRGIELFTGKHNVRLK